MSTERGAPPVVPAPRAPAGSADATRRWALRTPGGDVFPGLTRPEAEAVAARLAGEPPERWGGALAEIRLPAILSDGAGPHLLDSAGRITLALGPHPALPGVRLAMGEPAGRSARHAIGVVRRGPEGGVWWWQERAEVANSRRVEALDELAGCGDLAALRLWGVRWRGEPDGG